MTTATRLHDEAEAGGSASLIRELFGPGGAFADVWGKDHRVLGMPQLTGVVGSPSDLLATPLLRPPYIVLFSPDGEPLPHAEFCRDHSVSTSTSSESFADPGTIRGLLDGGASVKFNRMDLWCPPVREIAGALRAVTGREIMCWGFWSGAGTRMLPWHRDRAHVVALQVEGRKRWWLGGAYPEDGSWRRIPASSASSIVLEQGDVLYLPHGVAHCAAADEGRSFHLSFGLEGTTRGDLAGILLEHLATVLDTDDPGEVRPDVADLVVGDLRDAVRRVVDRLDGGLSLDREAAPEAAFRNVLQGVREPTGSPDTG